MQLHPLAQQLLDLKTDVLVVTFESPERAQAYVAEYDLPWPLVVDSEKTLYRVFSMQDTTTWNLFRPSNWGKYIRLLFKGLRVHAPTDNVKQLGGDVVVDAKGVIRLHYVSAGPTDRPSMETLLEVLRQGG
jgi:hypothetical protein